MSGNAAFNISILLKANAGQAKGTVEDFRATVARTTTEAQKIAPAMNQGGAAMDGLASKAEKAGQALAQMPAKAKIAADAALSAAVGATAGFGQLNRAMTGYSSTMATALQGGRDFSAGTREQVRDIQAANRESLLYRQALDAIRAQYNPLFAAQQRYQAELRDIAAAEKLTAISAQEAATARAAAFANLQRVQNPAASGPSNGMLGASTGYFAAQANDVAMMAMMGQNPAILALQQGPQISQQLNALGGGVGALKQLGAGIMSIINPMSLATIGVVAFGAAAVQWFTKSGEASKSLGEGLSDLASQVKRVDEASKLARSGDLSALFGSGAASIQPYLKGLAELERKLAGFAADGQAKAVAEKFQTSIVQAMNPLSNGQFMDVFDIGRFDSNGIRQAAAVQAAADDLLVAKTTDAQIAGLDRLIPLIEAAADSSGKRSKEEVELLQAVMQQRVELEKLKALEENAAGKSAAADMTRQLERQAAMQAVIARYGQGSAQARQLEVVQQKLATAEKLRGLGLDNKSVEFGQAMAAIDAEAAARAEAERVTRLRAHQDELATIARERQLLGATTAEKARATALAEAEQEIRDRSLTGLDAMLERWRAITRAAAEANLESAKQARDLQAALVSDSYDARIGLARDPLTRADLEAQKEYARLIGEGRDAGYAEAEATRIRTRAITEFSNTARVQAADMLDEVRIRQQVSAQVAAGAITAGDANRAIQQELQLRPLVAAAARAEGQEKTRLTEIITGLRLAYEAQAAEDRRQSQNAYLRGAAERVQQAKLELALIGQTAEVRARVLAMAQAERDIRDQGLSGDAADYARTQARELARVTSTIERQADAWKTVQSAGEQSIDAVLDKLKGGDVKGAFEGMFDEISGGFFDLAVRNPLKNAIMGTSLGTLGDVGGVSGIIGRLTGQNPLDEGKLARDFASPVQAMTIAATTVTINAASLGGLGAGGMFGGIGGGAANVNGPLGKLGGGDVPAQMWNFFAQKGLQPHQISGILGNAYAESRFDPTALQVGGNGTGLFQHDDRRFKLLDFIGGKQNLGDVNKQLEFVWQEFMTTESRAFKNLMNSKDVRGATEAMLGFERPRGFTWADPTGSHQYDTRVQAAQVAMEQFGNAAQTATADLGTLGSGMDGLGSALANAIGGAAGGGAGGDWLGMLVKLGGKAFGIPGFRRGGETGGSDPSKVAGVVHEQEYVFDAASTARIGVRNLEALRRGSLRGFRAGGYVGQAGNVPNQYGAAAPTGPSVIVNNYTGQQVREEETVDPAGRRQTILVIGEQMGAALSQPGNPAQKAMARNYGARRKAVAR